MRILELTHDGFRYHGLISSALNHNLFNHRVLTVHEVALKRITVLEAIIKSTPSESHSLINKFKDLEKKVSSMGKKINSCGGGYRGGG